MTNDDDTTPLTLLSRSPSKSPLILHMKRNVKVVNTGVTIDGIVKSVIAMYLQNVGGDKPVAVAVVERNDLLLENQQL